ncbi:NAD(P)/FAD-dependent oxidoreductase [Muriicola sp. Z0-33]|uniref:NAD(P)/FAD-dependent oxidoreductase n=1 Tax=Muriicola sp. Z0-33 TaxID=2816957 RepID=UPI002237A2D0|nr:NAD(P)/FAD-dependent oxidoreductase [Muriicola sp. Z0-33]MCW5515083.1 NAD(P)/FAD-dependent oxidoreductase [Muriicola sp. Z0-33]
MYDFDVIVVGGGAAGFYGAIQIAEANRNLKVAILERGKQVLSKVRVSGGGRCNVTHAEFDPGALTKNYPRGEKELLGPFHTHCTGDVVAFFEDRNVPLKIESDGRMFPVSDTSASIIDCFLNETKNLGIQLLKNSPVTDLKPLNNEEAGNEGGWRVFSAKKEYVAKKLLLTTGSNQKIWNILSRLGHNIIAPVPSLFTFNIKDPRISGIQGLSSHAAVEVVPRKLSKEISISLRSNAAKRRALTSEGPLLITHWGMSGPAILKLSAWGARDLNAYEYKFKIRINWLPDYHRDGVLSHLQEIKAVEPKKTILRTKAVEIPRRLWINLVQASGISRDMQWAAASAKDMERLTEQLTQSIFTVEGKSTFKEEFVTAGGVDLKEVNFKTFESKKHPHLYFAGEIINVDAITGGFNFQNAWTGAYIAAQAIASAFD